jgi:hypothetical protein
MITCVVCGTEIPEGRLKAIPGTKTCVNHSTASKFAANVVSYGNAEAGDLTNEIEIIRDEEAAKKLSHYSKQMGSYK